MESSDVVQTSFLSRRQFWWSLFFSFASATGIRDSRDELRRETCTRQLP